MPLTVNCETIDRERCSDQLMAFVATSDPNRVPSAKAIADARLLRERWKVEWIRRWDVKNSMTDQQFHAIKQALADHHPVASGLRWPKKLDGYKLLKVLSPHDVEDGHSIVFTGYTDDPKEAGGGLFQFRNSWGEDWGQHGYGEMSYGYARAYANDALWLHFGTFDLYSGRVCPSGSLEMGVLELNPGIHTLRCTAIGKNAASEGYFFGVDAIDLLPAP